MKPFSPGVFDVLVEHMPTRQIGELARLFGCDRKTLYRWHRGAEVTHFYKWRFNYLSMRIGAPKIFPEIALVG